MNFFHLIVTLLIRIKWIRTIQVSTVNYLKIFWIKYAKLIIHWQMRWTVTLWKCGLLNFTTSTNYKRTSPSFFLFFVLKFDFSSKVSLFRLLPLSWILEALRDETNQDRSSRSRLVFYVRIIIFYVGIIIFYVD